MTRSFFNPGDTLRHSLSVSHEVMVSFPEHYCDGLTTSERSIHINPNGLVERVLRKEVVSSGEHSGVREPRERWSGSVGGSVGRSVGGYPWYHATVKRKIKRMCDAKLKKT